MTEFKVDGDIGELKPGSTPRRWEPEEGVGKLNNRIHNESKKFDTHSNLPFTFSKPSKSTSRKKYVECSNCGTTKQVGVNCSGVICKNCNKFATVKEVNFD
jgi:hypothetical protein